MNQSNSRRTEQDVPLARTNRELWPRMVFHPGPGKPRQVEPGVTPVRCVEVVGWTGKGAPQQRSAGAGEQPLEEEAPPQCIECQCPSFPAVPEIPLPPLPVPQDQKGRGRPRILNSFKREMLLKRLRQGNSRTEAAKAVRVAPATIRLEMRRDAGFAQDVQVAEEEGQEFRRAFRRLFVPGRVRLEPHPVISTPQFEREKEFLIGKGLSRDWISRMRLVHPEEIEEVAEREEHRCRAEAQKGLPADLRKARNFLAAEEIVEEEFSPDGRQLQRVKIQRPVPASESVLADRVASLEMALDLPPLDLEMLLAQLEDRPWQCESCRKKQKPPGGTGGEERGTTTSTVQSEGCSAAAGDTSPPDASSIRVRRRDRRAGLAELHSLVKVSNTSGDS